MREPKRNGNNKMVTIDQLNANPFLQLMNGAKVDNNSFYVLNKIYRKK